MFSLVYIASKDKDLHYSENLGCVDKYTDILFME